MKQFDDYYLKFFDTSLLSIDDFDPQRMDTTHEPQIIDTTGKLSEEDKKLLKERMREDYIKAMASCEYC